MTVYPVRRSDRPLLWFIGGVAGTLFATLLLYWLILRPPASDMILLVVVLFICAGLALAGSFAAIHLDMMKRIPRFGLKLWAGYVLVAVLTIVSVLIVGKAMLISAYDLALLVLLILFVAGITVAVGYYQSAVISEKIEALSAAGEALALGRYHTRVEIEGEGELARLGAIFNALAEKMEAVNRKEHQLDHIRHDLIVWTGYDLRIPLTSLRTMVDALAEGVAADPESYRRFLRTAQRDANALSDLIDDLADMTQLNVSGIAIERQPVQIGRILDETAATLATIAAEKGVALDASASPDLVPVTVDARQVGRALHNLVRHAINRTPKGGSVKLHAFPARDGVLIDVVDIFEGARPEEMERVFELFFGDEESHDHRNSTRLSLAMAQAIVQAHGSRIRAQNVSGQGLRLVFTLSQHGGGNPLQRGM